MFDPYETPLPLALDNAQRALTVIVKQHNQRAANINGGELVKLVDALEVIKRIIKRERKTP